VVLVKDNGISAQTDTVQQYCGLPVSSSSAANNGNTRLPVSSSSAATDVNTNSNNDSLGSGAIAGIVIGSVVGAILLLILCILAFMCMRGDKDSKKGEIAANEAPSTPSDNSQSNANQVELGKVA